MFDGERVHIEDERLSRQVPFLLKHGIWPWRPRHIFEFPLITRTTSELQAREIADQMMDQLSSIINTRSEHEVFVPYRRTWQSSGRDRTVALLREHCLSQRNLMKQIDVSRAMFASTGIVYQSIFPNSQSFFEFADGTSTRYGDGQRYHNGGGSWSFSQLKGLRAHTGHIYVRGLSK